MCVQAPGRPLTHHDVNTGLIGRYAELYWPEDNLWYLMKIQVGDWLGGDTGWDLGCG